MNYLIDSEVLNFNNPADAVTFALNNNRSEVKVTKQETNTTECKSREVVKVYRLVILY